MPIKIFLQKASFFEILKLMRVHQWSKNLLIVLPLVMAHQQINILILFDCFYVILAFSLLASIIYILNDLRDLESDKSQEYKKNRSLASGKVLITTAIKTIFCLVVIDLALITKIDKSILSLFLAYLCLNFAYTYYFKKIVLLDLLFLTSFYLLRIFIGGKTTDIEISFWLLFFSSFFFLSLSILKRTAELQVNKDLISNSRGYQPVDQNYLSILGVTSGFATVVVLGLYINDENTMNLYMNPKVLWLSIPVVIYIMSKLWLDTFRENMHYDPVVHFFSKKEYLISLTLLLIIINLAT